MKLFVGIDVSSGKLDTCFFDTNGVYLKEVSLSNDVIGASKIKELVLDFHEQHDYSHIVIGMESTSVYSHHPATFLYEDDELNALGIVEVVVQNPLAINRYSKIFDQDKTDKIDARRIAEFLSIQRFIREEKYIALQRLTRSRLLLENLSYKCNTLIKELKAESGTSVFGATLMEILSDSLSLDEVALMEIEDLAALLQTKGRGRFKNPEKLAKTIQKAIRNAYRLGDMVQDSVDTALAMHVCRND